MIVRHVLIGAFFTLAGVVTLLTPSIPFICIGALVWGPIELMIGLFGEARRPRSTPSPDLRAQSVLLGWKAVLCPTCQTKIDESANWCPNCGAQLR